jgi:hypothetical protein
MVALDIAYSIFEDDIEKEDFIRLVNALGGLKWNFVRACLLYRDAMRCKENAYMFTTTSIL